MKLFLIHLIRVNCKNLGFMKIFCYLQGAVSGFLIGLIFCFVIGFGGPKPKAKRLPTEVKGCKNIIQTAVHRTFSSSLSGNLTSSVR